MHHSFSSFRLFLIPILCLSLVLPAGCNKEELTVKEVPSGPALVTFAVMGDVPYGLTRAEIEAEKAILRKQIADLNANDSIEFLVHVGDIKKGAPPCDPEVYETVAKVLQSSRHPLFIIPGDNEWNDCKDPIEAWRQGPH